MYNEKDFKNHIKHLKARRILYMLIFSILGSALGVLISEYIVDILLLNPILRIIIITISTLLFFWLSTLLTSNTEKDVQDAYWKLEVMKNLNSICEKLDNPVEFKKLTSVLEGETISELEPTEESKIEETTIVETLDEASNPPEIIESNEVDNVTVNDDAEPNKEIIESIVEENTKEIVKDPLHLEEIMNSLDEIEYDDDSKNNK